MKLQERLQILLDKLLVDTKDIPRLDALFDQTMCDLLQNIALTGSTLPDQYLHQLITDIIGNFIRIMLSQIPQNRNIAVPKLYFSSAANFSSIL